MNMKIDACPAEKIVPEEKRTPFFVRVRRRQVKGAVPLPAGVLLLCLLLFGCAGPGKRLEPPRIQIAGIEITSISPIETAFDVKLRVFNTAGADLKIEGIECELFLNGKSFGFGVSRAPVAVPSLGTGVVSLRLYSSMIRMFRGIVGIDPTGPVPYRIEGALHLGAPAFPSRLPFKSEGSWRFGGKSDS